SLIIRNGACEYKVIVRHNHDAHWTNRTPFYRNSTSSVRRHGAFHWQPCLRPARTRFRSYRLWKRRVASPLSREMEICTLRGATDGRRVVAVEECCPQRLGRPGRRPIGRCPAPQRCCVYPVYFLRGPSRRADDSSSARADAVTLLRTLSQRPLRDDRPLAG